MRHHIRRFASRLCRCCAIMPWISFHDLTSLWSSRHKLLVFSPWSLALSNSSPLYKPSTMGPSNMNASHIPETQTRDTQATYIHHSSGSEPDHLSPVHDNRETYHASGTQTVAPERPQGYWRSQKEWNVTDPLYVIESGSSPNRTYLRLNNGNQPYLSKKAPSTYVLDEAVFWYLEDRWNPGDFLLRNGSSRNETALAVWDVRDGKRRLIMSDEVDEIRANGAWRIVPFGST